MGEHIIFVGGWVDGPVQTKTKEKRCESLTRWGTIKYAVSTGRLDNKQVQVERVVSKRPDEFDGVEASDTNNKD